jgi:hypothetical protein
MKAVGWMSVWFGVLAVAASVAGAAEPAAPAKAPTFDEMHAKGVAANPAGVTFKISLKDGKSRFHLGEAIRLELQFSSSAAGKYVLDDPAHGLVGSERVVVDPTEGVTDLRADEFGPGRCFVGPWQPLPVLDKTPQELDLNLNDYIRIDKPGKYRMMVVSLRVAPAPTQEEQDLPGENLPVTSPILELEILPPDAVWADAQLREAVKGWEKGDAQAKAAALQTLRYLGTEAAARELVRLAVKAMELGPLPPEVLLGLSKSPHAAVIIKEMQAALEAPDRPILHDFFQALTDLLFRMKNPGLSPRLAQTEPSDPKKLAARAAEAYAKYSAARLAVEREVAASLVAALPKKTGRARSVSVATALSVMGRMEGATDAEFGKLLAQVRAQAPAAFPDLPLDLQQMLVRELWDVASDPAWVPVLVKAVEQGVLPRPESSEADVRNLMLKRLYQLAPEEGRKLILKELLRPARDLGRFSAVGLLILPDRTLPELDQQLANEAVGPDSRDDRTIAAHLLARYGSPAVANQVKDYYVANAGRLACQFQAYLLGYLLRVDEPYGLDALRDGLTLRTGPTRFYTSCLQDVSAVYSCPAMTKVVLEFLNDEDPQVVVDVARFLKDHGTADAKPALMKALERWHEAWKGRQKELKASTTNRPPNGLIFQLAAEQALVGALCEARAWILTPEELAHVLELCLADTDRFTVQSKIKKPGQGVNIGVAGDKGELTGDVEGCRVKSLDDLKAKIAQYPKGTAFSITAGSLVPVTRAKVLADLNAFMDPLGMTLREVALDDD